MPEPPDFKALAYRVASMHCESIGLLDEEIRLHPDALDDTIAFLKEIWNARGAADGAALKAELQRALDLGPQPEGSRPTINLEQMIKALDRGPQ